LDAIAPENLRVGNDNKFGFITEKSPGQGADVNYEWRLVNGCMRLATSRYSQFTIHFLESLPFAFIIAEDVNGIIPARPSVELIKELAPLRFGNLRVRRAFAERTIRVQRGEEKGF
jgi:hypothetical protein